MSPVDDGTGRGCRGFGGGGGALPPRRRRLQRLPARPCARRQGGHGGARAAVTPLPREDSRPKEDCAVSLPSYTSRRLLPLRTARLPTQRQGPEDAAFLPLDGRDGGASTHPLVRAQAPNAPLDAGRSKGPRCCRSAPAAIARQSRSAGARDSTRRRWTGPQAGGLSVCRAGAGRHRRRVKGGKGVSDGGSRGYCDD